LKIKSENIEVLNTLIMNGGQINLDLENPVLSGQNVAGDGTSDFYWRMEQDTAFDVYDTHNAESLFTVNQLGPVDIKNAALNMNGNALEKSPFRTSGYNNTEDYRMDSTNRESGDLRTSFYSSSSSTGSESAWLPVYEFHHDGGINRYVMGTIKAHCVKDSTANYHFREESDFNSGIADDNWGSTGNVVQNISTHLRLRIDGSDNSILRLELDLSNLSWPAGTVQIDTAIKCGGPVKQVYTDPN